MSSAFLHYSYKLLKCPFCHTVADKAYHPTAQITPASFRPGILGSFRKVSHSKIRLCALLSRPVSGQMHFFLHCNEKCGIFANGRPGLDPSFFPIQKYLFWDL